MDVISTKSRSHKSQGGFSLAEVMVASLVLAVGLVSVASMFATSLTFVKFAEQDSIARQEAQQMIEGIFAGRDTGALGFNQINNQIPGGPGIFANGWTPATQAGPDGILNTNDDPPNTLEVGPDGKPLGNFQRMITINQVFLPPPNNTVVDPNSKQIQVWVQYRMGRVTHTYTQVTYISRFR